MEFNFKHISDGTIMKYVKQLENNKAVGHDGLSLVTWLNLSSYLEFR